LVGTVYVHVDTELRRPRDLLISLTGRWTLRQLFHQT